jgi:hypothetical protein
MRLLSSTTGWFSITKERLRRADIDVVRVVVSEELDVLNPL